jgi:NTE family protein
VYEVLHDHPRGLRGLPGAVSGTSAGAMNAALIAAGLPPARIREFWMSLADRPPMVANRRFIASAQRAILKLAVREPLRGPGRRVREGRMLMRQLTRHAVYRSSGAVAAALAFLVTGRFDTISDLLNEIEEPYLFDISGLQERLAEFIGGRTFMPAIPLAVNAVDLCTGRVVRFVSHRAHKHAKADARHYVHRKRMSVDMVAASAAIPICFNPVRVEGRPMWDGGLLVNTPLAPVVALGARRIVTVLVHAGEFGDHPDTPPHLGAAIERLADTYLENAYQLDRKLLLDRNALASRLPERKLAVVELFDAIRPKSGYVFNAGSYVYFERNVMTKMYDAGKEAAATWLQGGVRSTT